MASQDLFDAILREDDDDRRAVLRRGYIAELRLNARASLSRYRPAPPVTPLDGDDELRDHVTQARRQLLLG